MKIALLILFLAVNAFAQPVFPVVTNETVSMPQFRKLIIGRSDSTNVTVTIAAVPQSYIGTIPSALPTVVSNSPLPIKVKPVSQLRAQPQTKGAQQQMSLAAQTFAVTNYFTIQFIVVPINTNAVMWVQSTSDLQTLSYTNIVGYVRNSAVVTETFGCTSKNRWFRLMYQTP